MPIKTTIIVIVWALALLPVSALVTVVAWPVWSWLEKATGIESMGHSGPATWCYYATYALVVAACLGWQWSRRGRGNRGQRA